MPSVLQGVYMVSYLAHSVSARSLRSLVIISGQYSSFSRGGRGGRTETPRWVSSNDERRATDSNTHEAVRTGAQKERRYRRRGRPTASKRLEGEPALGLLESSIAPQVHCKCMFIFQLTSQKRESVRARRR